MTIRLAPEQQSRDWPYPDDLKGFLEAVRADPDDDYDTRMRVEMFLMTPVARRIPAELRQALVAAGLWQEPRKNRLMYR